ncbi:hypothetical protein, partial [Agromyces humi]|uniref:hypothetical protein n=1 Tax=Agromyces humi TaxID=1766800 RepID=UPI0019396F12
ASGAAAAAAASAGVPTDSPRPVTVPVERLTIPQRSMIAAAQAALAAGRTQHSVHRAAGHRTAQILHDAGYVTYLNSFVVLTAAGAAVPEYVAPAAKPVTSLKQLSQAQRDLVAAIAQHGDEYALTKHEIGTAAALHSRGLVTMTRRTATLTPAGRALL